MNIATPRIYVNILDWLYHVKFNMHIRNHAQYGEGQEVDFEPALHTLPVNSTVSPQLWPGTNFDTTTDGENRSMFFTIPIDAINDRGFVALLGHDMGTIKRSNDPYTVKIFRGYVGADSSIQGE